ncbi:MAG: hypothetical protein EOM64_00785 [Erysipelotrichia bacterium]|nr:hypothetical protein [Erysipelotrichia bacterium]
MKTVKIYDYQCRSSISSGSTCIINVGCAWMLLNDINALRRIKAQYPGAKIMADLKITGEDVLNAKLAFDAGADIVSVMGIASDETLRDVQIIADENSGEVLVDMTGVSGLYDRLETSAIEGIEYAFVPQGTEDIDLPVTLACYESRLYSWLSTQEAQLAETAI